MSYDLMVFEPETAPKEHSEFLEWYGNQTEWREGHSYDDPAVSTPRLREFFAEISLQFPPLNGPSANEDLPEDEATATDYSIGTQSIYACFRWSKVEPAYRTTFELAAKHGLGFFNVSSENEEVWLPEGDRLVLAHQKPKLSLLARIFKRNSP